MRTAEADFAHVEKGAGAAMSSVSTSVNTDMQAMPQLVVNTSSRQSLEMQKVLFNVGLLMTQSTAHRYYFLADLEWLLLPPMQHHQFKLYVKDERPVAYVSWARLSEEAEERFVETRRLSPEDWVSGGRFWMVDLVAPYGGSPAVMADLHSRLLKGEEFKYWYQGPGGLEIRTIQSIEAQKDDESGTHH